MKLRNGVEIVSMSDTQRIGRVRLRAPFAAEGIGFDREVWRRLDDRTKIENLQGIVSQFTIQGKQDNFNFTSVGDVLPKDGDYITVNFRALSKTVVPGHWIDWTKDNVLEDSVALLQGATVYPNHDFFDINNALGSVSAVAWDADGANAAGVAGINAEYKIDALLNPRIARLLLMKPPAIHSTSMTVLFEFDYSHPDMAAENKWKFLQNLGEDVDGEIVRLIVTKIVEYWEASLVFQGADRLAKQYEPEEDDQEDFADMAANAEEQAEAWTLNKDEEKTMKLTAEQKESLGIEFDGEDVPEADILKAAESLAAKVTAQPDNLVELQAQAKAGAEFIEQQRTEVTRLAKLAELGADEGELDPVVAETIADAGFERLTQLKGYYEKRVGERFPTNGRSSQEDAAAVEKAGGVAEKTGKALPKVGVH